MRHGCVGKISAGNCKERARVYFTLFQPLTHGETVRQSQTLCSTIVQALVSRQAPSLLHMNTDKAAWLANIRAEAEAPGAVLVIVPAKAGSIAIFPDEIIGKSDDELLAFLAARSAAET